MRTDTHCRLTARRFVSASVRHGWPRREFIFALSKQIADRYLEPCALCSLEHRNGSHREPLTKVPCLLL